ncbi:MAG: hypothetical protein JSV85_04820 [Candidatus Bathyarchaeota archaeon]|nr:MAG: hypothetical protein JSV85_04820 [Candidatus Bathyarchaeota archaeon]
MSGGKKTKKEKKPAPGSTLALIGGYLFFLSLLYTPVLWLPRRPGPPFITADQWTALILTWVVGPIVSGVGIIVCSRLLKSKPKHNVALGVTILVFSLLGPSYLLLASPPASIDSLPFVILFLLFLYPGTPLGIVGGLCAIFRWGDKLQTAELPKKDYEEPAEDESTEPSEQEYQSITETEYEKLSDEEKHMKDEYEQLMGED